MLYWLRCSLLFSLLCSAIQCSYTWYTIIQRRRCETHRGQSTALTLSSVVIGYYCLNPFSLKYLVTVSYLLFCIRIVGNPLSPPHTVTVVPH